MWDEGHEDEYRVVSAESALKMEENQGKTVFIVGKPRVNYQVKDDYLNVKWPEHHSIVLLQRNVEVYHWNESLR